MVQKTTHTQDPMEVVSEEKVSAGTTTHSDGSVWEAFYIKKTHANGNISTERADSVMISGPRSSSSQSNR